MLEKIVNVFHTISEFASNLSLKGVCDPNTGRFYLTKNRSDKLIQGKTSDVKRVGMV
jgi:hypothetical protein